MIKHVFLSKVLSQKGLGVGGWKGGGGGGQASHAERNTGDILAEYVICELHSELTLSELKKK